ncbi:hypothetical protein ALC57_05718, partial [Trachymyrmex cornetzi]
ALVMTDPQVHYIEYPLPPKVRCLKCAKCFGNKGVGKVKGGWHPSDLPYLSKYLKKYHPGDTISYRCSANEARAKGKTSTTPTSRSPSYAAVTASPSTRSTTSSTTARSKTVAKSAAPTTTTREARRFGEAAATRNSPRTATVNKPCVVSVEIVKLPIKSISKTGVQNATKPARAPSHTPQRTSPEAGGFTTIRGLNNIMDQWRKTPPAILPSLPPTTRGSPLGSPGEKLISFSPETSLLTTLTTCTVTTTTCGSTITSMGFTGGVGRQITPPSCLPQRNILPTIGKEKTSPSLAVTTPPIGGFRTSPLIQPRPTTQESGGDKRSGGKKARRPSHPSSKGTSKQWGGQWTISVERRARRQQKHDRSSSNFESPPTAGPSRSPRIVLLSALIAASTNQHKSLSVSRMNNNTYEDITSHHNILSVGAERRRRETSPEDNEEGDVGQRTGTQVSAEHPSAPTYVRGVMSRRGAAKSPTVPPRADREEGVRRHHGRRYSDAPVGQPSRDHPAPATVARQRRCKRVAARDALLVRAKDVATIADLEAFAASIAAFFGEDVSTTGAADRARDRSARSREAGARLGARGDEPPERERGRRCARVGIGRARSGGRSTRGLGARGQTPSSAVQGEPP